VSCKAEIPLQWPVRQARRSIPPLRARRPNKPIRLILYSFEYLKQRRTLITRTYYLSVPWPMFLHPVQTKSDRLERSTYGEVWLEAQTQGTPSHNIHNVSMYLDDALFLLVSIRKLCTFITYKLVYYIVFLFLKMWHTGFESKMRAALLELALTAN